MTRTDAPLKVERTCTVEGCDRPHNAKGYCQTHYHRHKRGADMTTGRTTAPALIRGVTCAKCGSDEWGTDAIKARRTWTNKDGTERDRTYDQVRYRCRECDRRKSKARYGHRTRKPGLYGRAGRVRSAWNATRARLLAEQGGKCAICDTPITGKGEAHLDHDHTCCPGRVNQTTWCGQCARGVLCHQCNHLLGCAKDDTDTLVNAITYLTQPRNERRTA